jgi:hypothetical protein
MRPTHSRKAKITLDITKNFIHSILHLNYETSIINMRKFLYSNLFLYLLGLFDIISIVFVCALKFPYSIYVGLGTIIFNILLLVLQERYK